MKRDCVPVVVLLVVLIAFCSCKPQRQEWVSLGLDTKADLLVVFKAGVSRKEINQFMFDHLLAGDLEKGFWSRPGVGSILQASVEQHDGYVVYFQPSATPGQRRRIKEGILASPVVYRVFENTAPTEAHLK